MNFFSIKEYFYKLNTISFILLLLPMVAFIFLYYRSIQSQPLITQEPEMIMTLEAVGILFLIDLTIVHWLWKGRMKKLKSRIELADRMEGYFWFTLLKMASYCGCSLLMATGFFLTANSYFTGLFALVMITILFQWPTPSSFCRQLDLRGSERDMVIHNRDLPKEMK